MVDFDFGAGRDGEVMPVSLGIIPGQGMDICRAVRVGRVLGRQWGREKQSASDCRCTRFPGGVGREWHYGKFPQADCGREGEEGGCNGEAGSRPGGLHYDCLKSRRTQ